MTVENANKRIPIATIMGASDTLLMSRSPDLNKNDLYNEIFKASTRLNHLIENLLSMSRLESGKISVRVDWCDINDLINKVTGILKTELEQFDFITEIPADMPLVKLDFGLMEQRRGQRDHMVVGIIQPKRYG